MRNFDDEHHAESQGLGLKLFAGGAGFLLIFGVVAANLLSRAADKGELPTVAFVRSEQGLKQLARSAPVGQPAGKAPAAAGRGKPIDSTATAAISDKSPASSCDEGQALLVMRSVGVDGVKVTPIQGRANGAFTTCGDGR